MKLENFQQESKKSNGPISNSSSESLWYKILAAFLFPLFDLLFRFFFLVFRCVVDDDEDDDVVEHVELDLDVELIELVVSVLVVVVRTPESE